MSESDSLRSCRESFLGSWSPLYILLPQKQHSALGDLWSELLAVEKISAWKSASALAGQIIEALLRQRLLQDGHYDVADLSGKTLGQLMYVGRQAHVLPDSNDPLTGSAAVSSALTLRNWASHASLWFGHPTALRATQALALTICTVESLFPMPLQAFVHAPDNATSTWWLQSWNTVAPVGVLRHLEADPQTPLWNEWQRNPAPLFTHVLQYGSAKSVQRLLKLAHELRLDQSVLTACTTQQFSQIVRNAARSTCNSLAEVVWRLRKMGLNTHASVFAVLLPIDPYLLQRVLQSRSAAWVARYLGECSRAEPQLFAEMATDKKKMKPAIATFWQEFGGASGNIINMANILQPLPPSAKIAVLDAAPVASLTEWVRDSPPRDSVNLISSLNDRLIARAKRLQPLRETLLKALVSAVRSQTPNALHEIPLRLKRFGLQADSVGIGVVREVLSVASSRTHDADEWDSVRRIIWDVYAFYEALRNDAARAAAQILDRPGDGVPLWPRLCLLAIVDLECIDVRPMAADKLDQTEFLAGFASDKRDRWQQFAAAVGFARECEQASLRFPADAIPSLAALHSSTEAAQGPSLRLLQRIERLLSAN
jgi:hypothetical protein